MRHFTRIATFALCVATSVVGSSCTADIHDNTVNANANLDFKVDATVDVTHVKAGSSIPVNMNVDGSVVLVDPKTTPPESEASVAGHFEIFIDDTGSSPILVTAQTHVSVTIPASTSEGKHKLICRLDKHDGTPTDAEQEIEFTVTAAASVSAGSRVADSGA